MGLSYLVQPEPYKRESSANKGSEKHWSCGSCAPEMSSPLILIHSETSDPALCHYAPIDVYVAEPPLDPPNETNGDDATPSLLYGSGYNYLSK